MTNRDAIINKLIKEEWIINAEDAYILSQQAIVDKTHNQLKEIFEKIKKAISLGDTVVYFGAISDETTDILHTLGYEVMSEDVCDRGDYFTETTIKWDKDE